MQTMQQQLAMMQQLMLQQMALTQQPVYQPISAAKSKQEKGSGTKWNTVEPNGACNHWSPECRTKAEGHQDSATFQDRKGGAQKNWMTTWVGECNV